MSQLPSWATCHEPQPTSHNPRATSDELQLTSHGIIRNRPWSTTHKLPYLKPQATSHQPKPRYHKIRYYKSRAISHKPCYHDPRDARHKLQVIRHNITSHKSQVTIPRREPQGAQRTSNLPDATTLDCHSSHASHPSTRYGGVLFLLLYVGRVVIDSLTVISWHFKLLFHIIYVT